MKPFVYLLLPLLAACSGGVPEQQIVRDTQGEVRAELFRVDGKKEGEGRLFDAGHVLRTKGRYRNDAREGAWTTLDPAGNTVTILNYRRGSKDGIQAYWSPSGQVLRVESFADGRPEGALYRFFPDGKPRQFCTFKRGFKEGPQIEWFKSDSLKPSLVMGSYDRDRRDGEWRWYYDDSRIQARGSYERGKPVGIWYRWDRKGNVTSRNVDAKP